MRFAVQYVRGSSQRTNPKTLRPRVPGLGALATPVPVDDALWLGSPISPGAKFPRAVNRYREVPTATVERWKEDSDKLNPDGGGGDSEIFYLTLYFRTVLLVYSIDGNARGISPL